MPGQSYWLILLLASPAILVLFLGARQSALLLISGAAAAIGAAILEIGIVHTVGVYGLAFSAGGKAFLLFALPEEVFKYFATTSVISDSVSSRTLVKSAVVVAVGFASVENCIYVYGFTNTMTEITASKATLFRLLLPFSMHLIGAPILVCGHVIRNFKPVGGIFLAVMFHGTYDALALGNTVIAVQLSYLVMVLGFMSAGIVYRKAAGDER